MLSKRKREIRIQADSFREKCKISRYGIIDLFKECDRIGYKLLRYPLGENADLGFALKKMMIPSSLLIPASGFPEKSLLWLMK